MKELNFEVLLFSNIINAKVCKDELMFVTLSRNNY